MAEEQNELFQESDEGVDQDEAKESLPNPEPISYFGTDFDVHGLVRRLNQGDIVVPSFDPVSLGHDLEGFQRRFVWRRYQMERFVESLLLGYPVPGIFLVQQPDRKLLVLDGQQRLRTLQEYYGSPSNPGFALENVAERFVGKTYADLTQEERRSLDNTFIHGTIVKYDATTNGDDAVYQVFERLNTGGANLSPHEVRVALYSGRLVQLLRELNADAAWRTLYGAPSERLRDQELILRFAALFYKSSEYKRPLKKFLNDFVRDHRDTSGFDVDGFRTVFSTVCSTLWDCLGRRAFRATGQLNAALAESVMVGLARRIGDGPVDGSALAIAFDALLTHQEFLDSIGRATSDEDSVATRLRFTTEAFRNLQ